MEVNRNKLRDMVAGFRTNTDAKKAAFIDGWNMADKNPDWRSMVNEEPKEDGRYLTFDGECYDVGFYETDSELWFNYNNYVLDGVKLWMPLPKLPNEAIED